VNLRVTILPKAARLASVSAFAVRVLCQRFFVGHLGPTDCRLDVKLALQSVENDLKLEFADGSNRHLAGLLIGFHAQRRILVPQLPQAPVELFTIGVADRVDDKQKHRC
jgi:hypothetical protein